LKIGKGPLAWTSSESPLTLPKEPRIAEKRHRRGRLVEQFGHADHGAERGVLGDCDGAIDQWGQHHADRLRQHHERERVGEGQPGGAGRFPLSAPHRQDAGPEDLFGEGRQHQRERLLWTRLLLAHDEASPAVEKLDRLYTAALQTGHVYFRLEIQVVLVLAYSQQGSHEKARKQLHKLLETTRSEGYLRLYLDEGEELADLLRKLLPHLREKVLLAYARHILSAFAREIGVPALETTPGAALLLEPLSPQEQKVLRLLVAGNSNAEIARELVVSVNTVRTQVQSIYRKLNVNNRVEASAVANQLELV